MLFIQLHKTQREKALLLRDLFTQLTLATASSDAFESARNLRLGKCTADVTGSDAAKQERLQQEMSASEAAVLEWSARAVPSCAGVQLAEQPFQSAPCCPTAAGLAQDTKQGSSYQRGAEVAQKCCGTSVLH